MICSISGELASEPVVSRVTGYVYEGRLIRKALADSGKCPITGRSMNEEDLIIIQASRVTAPRLSTNLSIPGLLNAMQNEWDELMLETFQLKQSLDQTRQELAQALYQHDAALRVIARLMKERDDAVANSQRAAQFLSQNISTGEAMQVDEGPKAAPDESAAADTSPRLLPRDMMVLINDKCKVLSSDRKGRKPPSDLAGKDVVGSFKTISTLTPHKTTKNGICCVALSADEANERILSGGMDKEAIVTERASGKVVMKLTGHEKKVTDVSFHPDAKISTILTASADKTVKLWKDGTLYTTLSGHKDEVTSACFHPCGEYVASCSHDGHWGLWSCHGGADAMIRSISVGDKDAKLTKIRFHPDGLILGTGTVNHDMKLWDVREQNEVATLDHGKAEVLSMNFNENGYLCATAAADGFVRIWDLRKLKPSKLLDFSSNAHAVTAASFDYSGTYLAYTSGKSNQNFSIDICVVKEYSNILQSPSLDHLKEVTSIAWGHKASLLVTSSMDRTIKVHAGSN